MQSKLATNDNHNGIGQRLRQEMKKRGVSSVELARLADVKTSFLYDVISGKSANPSSIKLARVAESLGVSLTYLAGTSDSPQDGYQFSIAQPPEDYVSIQPVAGDGRSAPPCHFSRQWLKQTVGAAASDLRSFTVRGDNMSPTLAVGDMLLVNTSDKHPSPPGMFLVSDGAGMVVKRLELVAAGKKLRVSCDNPHYAAYESLIEETAIIGRVAWLSRAV